MKCCWFRDTSQNSYNDFEIIEKLMYYMQQCSTNVTRQGIKKKYMHKFSIYRIDIFLQWELDSRTQIVFIKYTFENKWIQRSYYYNGIEFNLFICEIKYWIQIYSIQHYMINLSVTCARFVFFPQVLQIPPPIIMFVTIWLKYWC